MMLALVMVFSLMPVNVLATDAEPVDEHTHAYVSAVTTAATCTEDGVTTYTCERAMIFAVVGGIDRLLLIALTVYSFVLSKKANQ